MYDHDQVVGGQLSSVVELRALPVGTIVGQVGEKGKVKHGGIIVVHDFGDGKGPVKAIYQSCGNNLGGPQYTPIEELGKWNIWLWHDGVTN